MRPFDLILIAGILIAGGMSLANKPDAAKPTTDCPCVDCTCDTCECGPVVVTPDEPEPPKPSGEAITYFFTMPSCVPCEQSRPHINAAHQAGYTVYVVDLDRQDLIDRYGIKSWPTTVVTKGGEEIERHVGYINGAILQGMFSINGIQPKQRIPAAAAQPASRRHDAYQMRAPMQTGWIRGGRVFSSACGPGGCS